MFVWFPVRRKNSEERDTHFGTHFSFRKEGFQTCSGKTYPGKTWGNHKFLIIDEPHFDRRRGDLNRKLMLREAYWIHQLKTLKFMEVWTGTGRYHAFIKCNFYINLLGLLWLHAPFFCLVGFSSINWYYGWSFYSNNLIPYGVCNWRRVLGLFTSHL